jgi:NADPH-dependent glutamate synthase beta subunit-like oxidoreductase
MPPCRDACPAHVDIPRYLRFIAEGKPAESTAVIREKAPFPATLGRVCIHPCEQNCQRTTMDNPISIRVCKRYADDHDTSQLWKQNSKVAPATGKRVAVVGGGPAGLTAAFYLAKKGHTVTVFEALPKPGGMMAVGIPDYRLPQDVLMREIDEIKAVGVDIKTNVRIESVDRLLKDGYDAVFLGIGAHEGMKMGVDGEDSPGVMDCATFLRDVNLGNEVKVGERVAVIGGGNAAVDAARVALRLGAKKVTMIYRRTRVEMPASPEEVEATLHEGIEIVFLAAPSRIFVQDGELKLENIRMELGEPDASGRRRPEPVKGSEYIASFDTIIAAIGQRPEIPEGLGVSIGRGNTITADAESLATDKEGVFAGGDVVSGPASVIEAIAAGRQGASSIDKYLGGDGDIDETLAPSQDRAVPMTRSSEDDRIAPAELEVAERADNFNEVEQEFSHELAQKEAMRCLMCDLMYQVENIEVDMGHCIFCGLCIEACPRDALHLDYGYEHGYYQRMGMLMGKDELLITGDKRPSGYARPEFEAELPRQTLLLDREKAKE